MSLFIAAMMVFATGAGCAHYTTVIHDVATQGDGWSLFVDVLMDGPDGFTTGGFTSTYHYPKPEERFFWLRIKLRNDAPMARQFNFDRCELDMGDSGIVPALVATAPIVHEADNVITVSPRETYDRYLIFSYPRSVSPTRLTCVPMVIRLPPIATR